MLYGMFMYIFYFDMYATDWPKSMLKKFLKTRLTVELAPKILFAVVLYSMFTNCRLLYSVTVRAS